MHDSLIPVTKGTVGSDLGEPACAKCCGRVLLLGTFLPLVLIVPSQLSLFSVATSSVE